MYRHVNAVAREKVIVERVIIDTSDRRMVDAGKPSREIVGNHLPYAVHATYTDDVKKLRSEFWELGRNTAIGAKVRANLVIVRTVPQSDAKKWRNFVPIVPVTSVCCTCVPGVLPRLPNTATRDHHCTRATKKVGKLPHAIEVRLKAGQEEYVVASRLGGIKRTVPVLVM